MKRICLFFVLLINVKLSYCQDISDYIRIETSKDTIKHGGVFTSNLYVNKDYLKDTSEIQLRIFDLPIQIENGVAKINFKVRRKGQHLDDTLLHETVPIVFKLNETIIEFNIDYWIKANPAYLKFLNGYKSNVEYEIFPDKFPQLKIGDFKNTLIEKFKLDARSGHLVITYIITKEGKLTDLQFYKNTFPGLGSSEISSFISQLEFHSGELNDEKVNTLDDMIIKF